MITGSADRVTAALPGDIAIPEWQSVPLKMESVIRARRLFVTERRQFKKVLGRVSTATFEQVRSEVRTLLGF